MTCQTSRLRSGWSYEINMFWDIGRAIRHTMRAGGRSRSSCVRPRDFRPSTFTPRPGTTRLATNLLLVFALNFCAFSASAQIPDPNAQQKLPPPPGQSTEPPDSKIRVDVNLVVLHTTVLDDRGRFADGLKAENFRVIEGKDEQ